MNVIDTATLAWLAGLLEGEGYFCLGTQNKYDKQKRIMIAIRMTDRDIIEKVARIFDARIQFKRAQTKTWKEVWCAEIYGRKAIDLMVLLYPYMGTRRKARINEIIAYWNEYRKDTVNASDECKAV